MPAANPPHRRMPPPMILPSLNIEITPRRARRQHENSGGI
jgi:hypothetical protein